jgi:hypothetical protein
VPSPVQTQYLRRTQAAVPLSILVTLAADAVAMVRHPRMWIGTASQNKLLALFAGMVAVSGGALWMIRSSAPKPVAPQRQGAMISSSIATALSPFYSCGLP